MTGSNRKQENSRILSFNEDTDLLLHVDDTGNEEQDLETDDTNQHAEISSNTDFNGLNNSVHHTQHEDSTSFLLIEWQYLTRQANNTPLRGQLFSSLGNQCSLDNISIPRHSPSSLFQLERQTTLEILEDALRCLEDDEI